MVYSFDIALWIFTVSSLSIFLVISTAISIMYNEKSFQYYALYLVFSILYILTKSPFESTLLQNYFKSDLFIADHLLFIMINVFYLKFFTSFLHYKNLLPNYFQWINESTSLVLWLSFIIFLVCYFYAVPQFFENYFFYAFCPFLALAVGFTILKTFFIKSKLKYFVLVGFFSYIIMSAISLYLTYDINYFNPNFKPLDSYYLGVILENFTFASGLAYKIKLLNNQKLEAQHRIISQQNRETKNQKELQQKIEEKLKRQEKELRKLHSKAEKEKLQKVSFAFREKLMQLQLEALRNQMDPHFVFNALNSIKAYLVMNDRRKAIYFLNKFSKLIRKALESLREDQISLKDELEVIDLYINVENLRFDSTVQYTLEVEKGLDTNEIKIPPLFIQPFIENALIHGLLPSDTERKLSIRIYKKESTIYIQIEDNGIGRQLKENEPIKRTRKSLGLQIIQERLNFYNLKHHTTLSYHILDLFKEGKAKGTKVMITITENENISETALN